MSAESEARRLRNTLRGAFNRAPELQPSPDYQSRLRDQLREVSVRSVSPWSRSRRWLALAAGILLAAVGTGLVVMKRSAAPAATLVRDAIGDHQYCALTYHLGRSPVPLEEAAHRFDSAYRVLLSAPPDEIATPDGPARVTERHSCAWGSHRFGHVIMTYRGHVVSLLMTTNGSATGSAERDALPHVLGRPMNGLSVVSVSGTGHAILLVSDLGSTELGELSQVISVPLARRLDASRAPEGGDLAALRLDRPDSWAVRSVDRQH